MAASDNVVRAGFTPKFKDVPTLTSMLTYSYAPISDQKMKPTNWPHATLNAPAYSSGSDVVLYNPPIPEFAVIRTRLAATARPGRSAATAKLAPVDGPSIVICTSGNGTISSTVPAAATGSASSAGSVPPSNGHVPKPAQKRDDGETISFPIQAGHVFFVSAGANCTFSRDAQAGGDDLVMYQAVCLTELSDGKPVWMSTL